MTNLTTNKPVFEYKHLLVFDTIALLSADKSNRLQVWQNNQKLGECYIPGATYAEISKISQQKSNSDFHAAKEFLDFVGKGGRYRIQPNEDNRDIPLDNEKDRQIIACAHRLARENPNCVVILVTYDSTMKGLSGQSGLPNFCVLSAKSLSDWFYLDYHRNKIPQAVSDAYQRIKQTQKNLSHSNSGQTNKQQNNFSKPQNQPNKKKNKQPRPIQQTIEPPKLQGNAQSQHQHSQNTPPQKKQFLTPIIIGLTAACAAVIALSTFNNFTGNNSATIVAQQVADNQPVKTTPADLITKAESSIIQFQNTKEPSILRLSLNELQTLKNQQALRLDKEGEQRLSRLKHKYAIEVLASSGQTAEAVKMLSEISPSYSDYKNVKKSLTKLKKNN
jgi:PIN domain